MREMLHTRRIIVVEGKYDAARLAGITDADILTTDGFSVYTDALRRETFKRLAKTRGLILLTDSDAAGFQIRTYLTNIVGEKYVLQAYVPAVQGKEPRKQQPGKEGLLGVEGIENDRVFRALQQALEQENADESEKEPLLQEPVSYTDLYEWGLSGTPGAAERKAAFLRAVGLPPRLSKKELVAVLNSLYTRKEVAEKLAQLFPEK